MKKTNRKFLRTSAHIKIKLGKRNKKKQKWRRARGRHNKIREKVHGKMKKVEIGYRTDRKFRNKIEGKIPVRVENILQAKNINKNSIVIIASVGKKKRIEIEKILKENNVEILNSR